MKLKKSRVYIGMITIFMLTSAFFIYFLSQRTVPLGPIKNAVATNVAPMFNFMIYGGFGEDALNKPMDVALIDNFIYVTDTNNKRIQVFDLGGTPIFMFGEEGTGKGQFLFPYGITGDQKGNIYVADLYNGCILIFDNKGKFIKYFAENSPEDQLIEGPTGIEIINQKLYVPDVRKNKVLVFNLQGQKIQEIGTPGTKPGELKAPNMVTADEKGDVYVVDSGNQRVEVFDKNGKFLRIINGSKDGKGKSIFVNPRGIGIDSRGILYVVSNLTNYLYGFDKEGKQVFVIGGQGQATDKFALPNGLYIDENDRVYITDTSNQRVAVYTNL